MAMDRSPGTSDYVRYEINAFRANVADAEKIGRDVEDFINIKLGRDAVRVVTRVRVPE